MNIRIGNYRKLNKKSDEIVFAIDRRSPVGNPFYMQFEHERDLVCEKYKLYFAKKIEEPQDTEFNYYLQQMVNIAKFKDIVLACWCYPKRCHGETIREYILNQIK